MKCPYCGFGETSVVDSRETEDLEATRRRRECEKCQKRFTTYERVELIDLFVIKKDGKREAFDRNKLLRGVVKACEKRPIETDKIEALVDDVEGQLRRRNSTDVKSTEIGELVMKKLKKMDEIAYIRFASVYRAFADVDEFKKEIKELLKK